MLAARPARADEALARQHFKRGVAHYDAKRYEAALEEFQNAYREKPSAGIKQNIALTLKALGRIVEATTAFDEALEEGRTTLRQETRAAIEREIAELSKIVATVNLSIVDEDGKEMEADVTVDGTPIDRAALARPIRLTQGIHVFRASAKGFPDPPEKKLALLAGQPVDATFVITKTPPAEEGTGTLTVRTERPDAVIKVDGREVGRGTFTGEIDAGRHQVEVSAPGHRTTTFDVSVTDGASVDFPVQLVSAGDAPEPYDPKEIKPPPKEKKFQLTILGALEIANLETSEALGEAPGGKKRPYVGGAVGVRAGGYVATGFSVELTLMLGALNAKYRLMPNDGDETSTSVGHWQITPGIRWHTPGKVRFVVGTGFGLHGTSVTTKIPVMGATQERNGRGVAFSWLSDIGMQFVLGSVVLEAVLFGDVFGVGPVRDDAGMRLLYASPAARIGARAGVTFLF